MLSKTKLLSLPCAFRSLRYNDLGEQTGIVLGKALGTKSKCLGTRFLFLYGGR